MAIDKEISRILTEFGVNLNDDTRSSLKKKLDERAAKRGGQGVRESRLGASVKPHPVSYSNGTLRLILTMNDHWEAVNDGRSPTTKGGDGSLRKRLEEWIATRKIKVIISKKKESKAKDLKNRKVKKAYKQQTRAEKITQMAYAMATNIHKNGIPPTQFFDEVIKDGRIEELKERLAEVIKAEIIIDIKQSYK